MGPAADDLDARVEGGASACARRGADTQREGVEVVVGNGRDATLDVFRPLADDPGIWLTPGEQGLQHVVLALASGRGFDPVGTRVRVVLVRARDCEPLGETVFRRAFRADPTDPTRLALDAFRVLVVDGRDPLEYCSVLRDGDVDVLVDLDDGAGVVAHREARVRVRGLDPAVRPELRDAWQQACERDGGSSP